MGISSDGILVFGIDLGEEQPEFMGECDGFDDYMDSQNGLPQWGEVGHDWDATHAFRNSYPASMTLHCSYDYPMHILAVPGTETTAYRGSPKEIEFLSVSDEKVDAFKAWCVEHGIEDPEPKWLLASMYG